MTRADRVDRIVRNSPQGIVILLTSFPLSVSHTLLVSICIAKSFRIAIRFSSVDIVAFVKRLPKELASPHRCHCAGVTTPTSPYRRHNTDVTAPTSLHQRHRTDVKAPMSPRRQITALPFPGSHPCSLRNHICYL